MPRIVIPRIIPRPAAPQGRTLGPSSRTVLSLPAPRFLAYGATITTNSPRTSVGCAAKCAASSRALPVRTDS